MRGGKKIEISHIFLIGFSSYPRAFTVYKFIYLSAVIHINPYFCVQFPSVFVEHVIDGSGNVFFTVFNYVTNSHSLLSVVVHSASCNACYETSINNYNFLTFSSKL